MLGLSPLHSKKHLSFSALRKLISERVSAFDDSRQQGKVDYSLHDCCQSAFAMMFFQDPSINAFQERLQEKRQLNNLKMDFPRKSRHVKRKVSASAFHTLEDIDRNWYDSKRASRMHMRH